MCGTLRSMEVSRYQSLPSTSPSFGVQTRLERQGADGSVHSADAAVGQAGDHDAAAVQGLQPAIVAAMGNARRLDAAGIDHAAVPVLAEVRIAPRSGASIQVVGCTIGGVEHRAVPPGVAVGSRGVIVRRQRSGRCTVGPGGIRRVAAAAGPDAPGHRAGGEPRRGRGTGKVRPGAKRHPLGEQDGVARAVLDLYQRQLRPLRMSSYHYRFRCRCIGGSDQALIAYVAAP